jgi:hypothetical protein
MKNTLHNPGGKSKPKWPEDSKVSATFSKCQKYRYQLKEVWDPKRPLVLWLLMNPSVACIEYSDPTLRRTGMFSRAWGYGGQLVGNILAYRSTDKMGLLKVDNPIGPKNNKMILDMAKEAKMVVLAYGQPPKKFKNRGKEVVELLKDHSDICYLKLSQNGTPIHPLYLPANLEPVKL